MPSIVRNGRSNPYIPSQDTLCSADTLDRYLLWSRSGFQLPVLVAGKTLLSGLSARCATLTDPQTVAFTSASTTQPPPRGHWSILLAGRCRAFLISWLLNALPWDVFPHRQARNSIKTDFSNRFYGIQTAINVYPISMEPHANRQAQNICAVPYILIYVC